MKRISRIIISLSIVVLLFSLNSCVYDFTQMNVTEIDSTKIDIALSFADDYLSTLKLGEIYHLTDILIPEMKEGLDEQNQPKVYQAIKKKYGDYQSVAYAESWNKGSHVDMYIVRLKGSFSNSAKNLEIRVVLNEANKIAGFWIKPWAKKLL